MPYAKTSLRAEHRALREQMRGLGLSRRQIAVEFARRYRLRPRAAWRHAYGWSLKEAGERISDYAARSGLDPDGTSVAMTAPHLSEYENWPGPGAKPAGRRPTPYLLSLLASVYECAVHDLLDLADYERMPAADRLIIDKTAPADEQHGHGQRPGAIAGTGAAPQATAAAQPPPVSPAAGHLTSWPVFAPGLEPGMVDRPSDLENLISMLTDAVQAPTAAKAVAVVGPGGFGKTTLATQACHDPRITSSFSEILWVETGEQCTPARVVQLASDLCVHLDGERPTFSDAEQAGFHLARVLGDRRVLITIDNVWSAADLAPFLLGGPNAVLLVTTRNARVCPAHTLQFRLGPMSASEVRELLNKTVPALRREDTVRLAGLCNGWPLLASVVSSALGQDVGAGAAPARAVFEASRVLDNIGPQAFDVWDSDQRKNAIGHAITASLRSLEEHVQITGTQDLRNRYLSLAIFPAATPVPLSVLSQWWGHAYEWAPSAVRQFCRVLADRSLIDAYLADRDAVVLHDVFRVYLRHLIGPQWPELHQSLVDSYRPLAGSGWAELGSEHSYLWRHLAHHLHEAGLSDELAGVLASPEYVVKKAAHLGNEALALDRDVIDRTARPDTTTWRTAQALTGAGYLLHGLTSRRDIAGTLLAALSRTRVDPGAADRLRGIAGTHGFDILWATTEPAGAVAHTGAVAGIAAHGNALVSGGEDGVVRIWDLAQRRLVHQRHGHTGWIYAVAISPDGQIVASAGDDATIRLWRLDTGQPAGILFGHDRRIRSLAFAADGRLVSGAEDGLVCLWDIESASMIRTLRTPGSPVWAVAADVAGSLVAAAGEDEFVRLYDRDSGTTGGRDGRTS